MFVTFRHKVCKHELVLNYLHKRIEMLPHATALPLQYIRKEKAKEEATEYQHEEANTVWVKDQTVPTQFQPNSRS